MQSPGILYRRFRTTAAAFAVAILWSATTLCQAQTLEPATPGMQIVKIPMKGAGVFGSTLDLSAEVFKPSGQGPGISAPLTPDS